jgi:hypothetical protein
MVQLMAVPYLRGGGGVQGYWTPPRISPKKKKILTYLQTPIYVSTRGHVFFP